jgi:SNF2 family DNA or RNA helicase
MIYDILYPYQQKIVNVLKDNSSGGLFTDTGTGKSYMAIALYQDKLHKRLVNKCLVICLLGKIEEWERDFRKFQPFDRILIMDGKKETMKKYRQGLWDVCIINFERTWRTSDLLTYTNPNTMIIIDESHKIKESKTKQGDFIAKLGLLTPYKLILTATPMGNGYVDIYNQFYFLGLIGMSKKQFDDMFIVYKLVCIPGAKPFKQVNYYKNTKILDELSSKYCYFYERPVDEEMLPSEIQIDIKLDKQYNKIAKDRVYEDIVLDSISAKRLALKSLCSGSIMGKTLLNREDKVYQLNNNKIEWVKTFLETFSDRVVIFYQYTHQMDQLYNEIKKMKRNVARYNADFKEKDIFMENKDCVILVQYKSGGTGIDWLKNSYVGIFYSLPDSYIEYYQAKGRIDRNGQTKKPLFYVLTSTGSNSVDKLNYEALKNKQDFNDEYFQNCFGGK